jgi:hypothetical protein
MSGSPDLDRASEFVWSCARLLERRILEHRFHGASAASVVTALLAYRNEDGGFGHALEPDLRAPTSQPLFVSTALAVLRDLGVRHEEITRGACDFVATVAGPDGGVPALLPSALEYPRASHWDGPFALEPSLNCTAAIAAQVWWQGVRHPWLEQATDYCWRALAGSRLTEAHELLSATSFLASVPDRDRAAKLFDRVGEQVFEAEWFTAEVPVTKYTLTPLHFAPAPDAPCRRLFSDAILDAHLDDLAARQQEDGGWPIFWQAPDGVSHDEWRGIWTLEALATLRAWGRLV